MKPLCLEEDKEALLFCRLEPSLWGRCVFPWRSEYVFMSLALKHQPPLLSLTCHYEGISPSEKLILILKMLKI